MSKKQASERERLIKAANAELHAIGEMHQILANLQKEAGDEACKSALRYLFSRWQVGVISE